MKINFRNKKITTAIALLLALIAICTGCNLPASEPIKDSGFSIHFIDVGQGDAALVECDGHYMLIDGGTTENSSKMYAVLMEKQIDYLDYVVGTHPDADHIGGLAGALNYASAGNVLCSVTEHDTESFQNFKKYADRNGGGIRIPKAGEQFSLGTATVTVLSVNTGFSVNDDSIVLKIAYGKTSVLFTGDAEYDAEQTLLKNNIDISADVLKVGHHGSASSTSEAFLNAVNPSYAIISVGENNDYQHPTDVVLNRLEKQGTEIYRTDLSGEIYLTSDGRNIAIHTEKTPSPFQNLGSGTENNVSEDTRQNISCDYILNLKSKKFHYPECKSVQDMSEKNKGFFDGTREELLDMEYEPCGNCCP